MNETGPIMNHSNNNGQRKLLGYGNEVAAAAVKTIGALPDSVWGKAALCSDSNIEEGDENFEFNEDLNIQPVALNVEMTPQYTKKAVPPATVDYHLVMRGFTTASGLCRAKIPLAGNYLVKIVSKGNASYTSNVISLNEATGRTLYAASLKPALIRVVLSARLPLDRPAIEEDPVDETRKFKKKRKTPPLSMIEQGCLMCLVNIVTGSRHLIALSVLRSPLVLLRPNPLPSPLSTGGHSLGGLRAAEDGMKSRSKPKAKVHRQPFRRGSIIELRGKKFMRLTEDDDEEEDERVLRALANGSIVKIAVRGKLQKFRLLEDGEEDEDDVGGEDEEEPNEDLYSIGLPKVEETSLIFQLYATEVRLPTGKYLCEMDGSILDVCARPLEVVVDGDGINVEIENLQAAMEAAPLIAKASSFLSILTADLNIDKALSSSVTPNVVPEDMGGGKRRDSLEMELEKGEYIDLLLDTFPSGGLYKDFSVPCSIDTTDANGRSVGAVSTAATISPLASVLALRILR
jgi:hypothetical protein